MHSESSNPFRIVVVSQMCINIVDGVIVISIKNALYDPVTLTSDLSTPKPHRF